MMTGSAEASLSGRPGMTRTAGARDVMSRISHDREPHPAVSRALLRVARHPVVSHSSSHHAARTDQAVLRAHPGVLAALRAAQGVRRGLAGLRAGLRVRVGPAAVPRRLPVACPSPRLPVAVAPAVRVVLAVPRVVLVV